MATTTAGGLRFDNLVNLGFSFSPTMAMSAKAFDKFGLDIRSFREPLKRSIQQVVAPSIRKNFIAHGRPDTWAPYADGTVQVKMRDPKNKFGAEDLLRRSGLLWKTMQQYNIWAVTTTQAAILDLPEKIWYGAIHQGGYSSGGGPTMTLGEARAAGRISGKFATPAELAAMGGGGTMTHLAAKAAGLIAGEFATPAELRAMGGGGRAANIPARPFALFQDEDIVRIEEVFYRWIEERAVTAMVVKTWQ